MVGDGDGWEGEAGVGWQEYQFRSFPEGKQRGGESRCMGIQKSLHMHATQIYTASYSLRKNNTQEGRQAVDMKDWSGGKL